MELYYSAKFLKSYQKLPERLKALAEKKIDLFITDRFHSSLQVHKLHGNFVGFLSFSVNKNYRVIFDFLDKNIIRFYDIGTHDIYK